MGARVLLVDLDHQGMLTRGMGIVTQELQRTIYDLLVGDASLSDVLLVRGKTGILPASHHLAGIEQKIIEQKNPALYIRDIMEQNSADLKRFDYILYDTPSNLGLLTLNALTVAEYAVVPVAVGPEALVGIENVTRYIEHTRERLNSDLSLFGAIPVLYDPTDSTHIDSLVGIGDYFGDVLFQTPIRKNRAIAEALSDGYTIYEYAPDSRATSDYMSSAEELALRM